MQVPARDFIKVFLHCAKEENPDGCGTNKSTGKQLNQLTKPPSVTQRAIFFGFPVSDITKAGITKAAVEPFARTGVIAYIEPNPELWIEGKQIADAEMYLVDAPSSGGNSGGPVLREPLPSRGGVEVWGLVTGGSRLGGDSTLVTSVRRIHEALVHARSRAQLNRDGWQKNTPTLRIRCTPDLPRA